MGYDLASLASEVHDGFLCSICTKVLENSMVSPCEHTFCYDCIEGWLKVKPSCPVDSCSLTLDDLKPTPQYFRKMFNKVKLKCNFEPKGCQAIVPLEQLYHHLSECVFNPNAIVIGDKQQDQITKLNDEVSRLEEDITMLNAKVDRQREDMTKLSDTTCRDDFSKLNDELSSVRCQVTHSQIVISQQREEITKLTDELSRIHLEVERQRETFAKFSKEVVGIQLKDIWNLSVDPGRQWEELTELSGSIQRDEEFMKVIDATPGKWQICENMKTTTEQPLILEYDANQQDAFAQAFLALAPTTPAFRIKVLNVDRYITIGLTRKGHPTNIPVGVTNKSIGFFNDGCVYVNSEWQYIGKEWINGDIIECRIIFPENFVNDGKTNVEVNFIHNGQLIFSKYVEMPMDGFHPSVYMWSNQLPKIEFF